MKPIPMTEGTLYQLIRTTHIGILAYYEAALTTRDYFLSYRLIPFLQHVESNITEEGRATFRYQALTLSDKRFELRFIGTDAEQTALEGYAGLDRDSESLLEQELNDTLVSDVLDAARDYDARYQGLPKSDPKGGKAFAIPPEDDKVPIKEALDPYRLGWEHALEEVRNHIELGTDYSVPVPDSLQDLYTRLHDAPPLPQYIPGSHVWFLSNNKVYGALVGYASVQSEYKSSGVTHSVLYHLHHETLGFLECAEDKLFPTKQDLLSSL